MVAGCAASSDSHVEAAGRSEGIPTAPQLHVSGDDLVGANGRRVVLRGVNRSGGQFACVQGLGIWSGPMNQASVAAMRSWGVNAVRVPLNEACWNGEPYVDPSYRGTYYQRAVAAYVQLLNRDGMVAILDLHWTDGAYTGPSSACSSAQAVCQKPMPDAAQSIPFWRSVARTFKNNDAVIFDLFNEPYPDKASGNVTEGWNCWLHGGMCKGISYQVAGMQSLVNVVRSAGAKNVIMLGGLTWANNLTQWVTYEPSDPDHNLAASWHSYSFNSCNTSSCWDSQVAPVVAKVPVIVGEMGEKDCADTYIDPLIAWLDSKSTSYLAWSWNVGKSCESGPSLISGYDGTPTSYGAGYRSDLLSLRP
ncbi:MAG TPA: cellulase family glycosylhydrolase [Streptosporangiaceae bacterium]|nr:cellulase family glycosylhydrolase [Streptosporangiaceae bacterium]